MVDNVFLEISAYLQGLPSIFVSLINFLVCIPVIFILLKYFGYAGLCSYMVLCAIIGNIQVLYATSYEVLNIETFLGTTIFCSSFFACDLINLKFGSHEAKKAVILTVITDLFFLLNIILTLGHKPLDYNLFSDFGIPRETIVKNIESIKQIFVPVPRLLLASYATYFISQTCEIAIFNKVKRIKSKRLNYILHNVSLFVSSIVVDTIIFTYFAFCFLSENSIALRDFWNICSASILIRFICNAVNSSIIKVKF